MSTKCGRLIRESSLFEIAVYDTYLPDKRVNKIFVARVINNAVRVSHVFAKTLADPKGPKSIFVVIPPITAKIFNMLCVEIGSETLTSTRNYQEQGYPNDRLLAAPNHIAAICLEYNGPGSESAQLNRYGPGALTNNVSATKL